MDLCVYVCRRCDTVVTRFIDPSAEWRFYGGGDHRRVMDPSRCGPPQSDLLPTMGTTGLVVCRGRGGRPQRTTSSDAAQQQYPGRRQDGNITRVLQKFQMWNALSYRQRSLLGVFDLLTTRACTHGISLCILDEAKNLYKRVSETRIFRGENRHALVACSIYMACKANRVPRTLKEIAAMFDVKPTCLTKACKQYQDLLDIQYLLASTTPDDFVGRFGSRLGLSRSRTDVCREVIRRVDDAYILNENTPPSIVASVIYLCNMDLGWGFTKKQVAEACQISQVTINKCFKKLVPHRGDVMEGLVMFDVGTPPPPGSSAGPPWSSTTATTRRPSYTDDAPVPS